MTENKNIANDQDKANDKVKFGAIDLSPKVAKAIFDMGFEEPSPIQAKAIPVIMQGKDLIGQAQTGTGKTATFGIPMAEALNPRDGRVQALVLCPTRELAIQVAQEISKIGRLSDLKSLPVYGGQSIDRQIRALRYGVQVVIGTPGRILDHLSRKTLRLNNVRMVVLDEADEMLDMGFIEDIEAIIKETPEDRQTLLFSATMPGPIQQLARQYMKEPEFVTISRDKLTVPLIEQVYYECKESQKVDALCRILDMEEIGSSIIFCRTKRGVDELVAALETRGYFAEGLHGDLTQAQRDRVMKKFRDGKAELLIATDVAARGLDVENVTHVINYDIPQDPESYVHRIGRTGRAGRKGIAITLINYREYRQLKLIERVTKARIQRRDLPSMADIVERQKEAHKMKIVKLLDAGHFGEYKSIISELAEDYDPMEIAAATLKLLVEGPEVQTEKEEAPEFGNTGAEPGMVRLFMNIGRAQGIRPQDIVRAVAEEAGIPGNVIGVINIYDKFTFVEVPEDVAGRVMGVMHQNMIKGRKISVEPAKAR
ncbi:DEAD/DEAH box helicase [Heliobacterium gestii]|uniref:ATP-dependent RNA helicase CshA n=1 Tax=Heliomicrobium gestii TaxID=2699 RepID=A0A845LAR2_HELGE|nr:DEAD/DEAH box helicase [Heliomicrobium gestii]MBM7867187.1 ATP-dependent RNA helicase DeaD [Heliomicrobium gestii]MZP43742.1 DEAD/DEAH box helicase [Heliomicrobium gestii]